MTFIPPTGGQAQKLYCAVSSSAVARTYDTGEYYIVGSDIDYEPADGCSYVEYRFQALANYSPEPNDLLQFSLVYDTTVSIDPAANIGSFTEYTGYNSGWGGNVNSQTGMLNLRFTIPAWTGERRWALKCRAYAGTLRGTLHWTDQFREDDVDAAQATSGTFVYSPHLIVYSY
ncbi:MAG: hypothetical protein ACW99U_22155 [Candidatus Thorarchaeota archaeon]|jgi:hypothetical protein